MGDKSPKDKSKKNKQHLNDKKKPKPNQSNPSVK